MKNELIFAGDYTNLDYGEITESQARRFIQKGISSDQAYEVCEINGNWGYNKCRISINDKLVFDFDYDHCKSQKRIKHGNKGKWFLIKQAHGSNEQSMNIDGDFDEKKISVSRLDNDFYGVQVSYGDIRYNDQSYGGGEDFKESAPFVYIVDPKGEIYEVNWVDD